MNEEDLKQTLRTYGADTRDDTVPDALRTAILAVPREHRQIGRRRGLGGWLAEMDLGFFAPRLAGMAFAGVLGFYLGFSNLVTVPVIESDPVIYDLSDLVFDTLPQEDTP